MPHTAAHGNTTALPNLLPSNNDHPWSFSKLSKERISLSAKVRKTCHPSDVGLSTPAVSARADGPPIGITSCAERWPWTASKVGREQAGSNPALRVYLKKDQFPLKPQIWSTHWAESYGGEGTKMQHHVA